MTETKTILLKDLIQIAKQKHGWPTEKTGKPSPQRELIENKPIDYWKKQHDQGKTLKQVAAELNVSPGYLSHCLTRIGIYWREL